MEIIIIVAKSKNNVIGKCGKLPWNFPEDLKHFRETTMGNFVIMGKKTFLSLPGKLDGRKVIVLSRDKNFNPRDAKVANSIEEAINIAEGKVFVAGGESVYHQFLSKADKMIITVIDKNFEGDAHFPEFDKDKWRLVSEKKAKNKLLIFKKYKKDEKYS